MARVKREMKKAKRAIENSGPPPAEEPPRSGENSLEELANDGARDETGKAHPPSSFQEDMDALFDEAVRLLKADAKRDRHTTKGRVDVLYGEDVDVPLDQDERW